MLTRDEIRNELYTILDEANLLSKDEGNHQLLSEAIDSVQLISLVVEIEVKFDIEIPDQFLAVDLISDIEHMIDVIEDTMNGKILSCE